MGRLLARSTCCNRFERPRCFCKDERFKCLFRQLCTSLPKVPQMTRPKQLLSFGAILVVIAIAWMSSGARGKEDADDKRPAVEEQSLFDEISKKSHPIGRILAARIKE